MWYRGASRSRKTCGPGGVLLARGCYRGKGGEKGSGERTDSISGRPGDERHGDDGGFLGLAGDVAGDHGQAEGLGGPEGESDVVADQETDLGGQGGVLDGHQDDGTDVGSVVVLASMVDRGREVRGGKRKDETLTGSQSPA